MLMAGILVTATDVPPAGDPGESARLTRDGCVAWHLTGGKAVIRLLMSRFFRAQPGTSRHSDATNASSCHGNKHDTHLHEKGNQVVVVCGGWRRTTESGNDAAVHRRRANGRCARGCVATSCRCMGTYLCSRRVARQARHDGSISESAPQQREHVGDPTGDGPIIAMHL